MNLKMLSSYKSGIISESLAKIFLQLKFYKIINSRFKTKFAEIDVIAQKQNVIIFVEVKYRKKINLHFHPINQKQLGRIKKAAAVFLSLHPEFASFRVRFDYIEIEFPRITHLINAF